MAQNIYPGGVSLPNEVSICRALPANTTPVTIKMTPDGSDPLTTYDPAIIHSGEQMGVVTTGGSTTAVTASGIIFDANVVGGYILFTTGNNKDKWRTIKTRSSNTALVIDPLPLVTVAGDTFIIYKPVSKIHSLDLWLPVAFTNTAWVAVGEGVVAGNNTPPSLLRGHYSASSVEGWVL